MDIELARRFGALVKEKRDLEAELRRVKDEMGTLEPLVLDEMQNNQMDRMHLDGQTIYMHRILTSKAKGGNRNAVVAALKAEGLGDLVAEGYNANSLSAWVREQLAADEPLPPLLAATLDLEEIVSIRGRQSAAPAESKSAAALRNLENPS
jgi:hypothetical protein